MPPIQAAMPTSASGAADSAGGHPADHPGPELGVLLGVVGVIIAQARSRSRRSATSSGELGAGPLVQRSRVLARPARTVAPAPAGDRPGARPARQLVRTSSASASSRGRSSTGGGPLDRAGELLAVGPGRHPGEDGLRRQADGWPRRTACPRPGSRPGRRSSTTSATRRHTGPRSPAAPAARRPARTGSCRAGPAARCRRTARARRTGAAGPGRAARRVRLGAPQGGGRSSRAVSAIAARADEGRHQRLRRMETQLERDQGQQVGRATGPQSGRGVGAPMARGAPVLGRLRRDRIGGGSSGSGRAAGNGFKIGSCWEDADARPRSCRPRPRSVDNVLGAAGLWTTLPARRSGLLIRATVVGHG